MDGYIYIMTNPGFKDNLVKIGYSKNPEQRRKELSRESGTPAPYKIYALYAVQQKLSDKSLHKLIDTINPELRLSKNKEFYEVSPEIAYNWLEAISQISHTENRLSLYKPKEKRRTIKNPLGNVPKDELFYIKGDKKDGPNASMKITDGRFVVLAGSKISQINYKSLSQTCRTLRNKYLSSPLNGVIDKDVIFSSPSGAAVFVCGYSVDGYDAWKNCKGKSLSIYRK